MAESRTIYETNMMGVKQRYIENDSSWRPFIWEQKRHLGYRAWAKMLIRSLWNHGFTTEKINEIAEEILKRDYFNKEFYVPIWKIVQEQIDLSC